MLSPIYLLVSDVTRMMYPDQFVERLAPTGAQLQSDMKTVVCFLCRDTAEIPVLVVVNWFLYKEKRSFVTYNEHIVQLFILRPK